MAIDLGDPIQAHRLSERARLPFGSDSAHGAVIARVRRGPVVSLTSTLVAVVLTTAVWRTCTPDVLLVSAGMTASMLAAGVLGLVPPVWSGAGLLVFGLFPWWGIPALQVLYSVGQGRLRADLLPRAPRATADGRQA
ncbi:hypothetical protein [Microbacterium sp. NPDC077184]|uniref:hypothetical protein n=1 Tax=Microbacterium sp. NPDC077184 TaxID=3154764 RepID=UPI003421E963